MLPCGARADIGQLTEFRPARQGDDQAGSGARAAVRKRGTRIRVTRAGAGYLIATALAGEPMPAGRRSGALTTAHS
jgi:hypothetical protein